MLEYHNFLNDEKKLNIHTTHKYNRKYIYLKILERIIRIVGKYYIQSNKYNLKRAYQKMRFQMRKKNDR